MKYQIPIGVSDFAEIRKNEYYYVDKTALIEELLKTSAASPTISKSLCRVSSAFKPLRNSVWSSMSAMRIFFAVSSAVIRVKRLIG